MFDVFTRSWELTKLSFGVINKDRELLLFPLLAGIFSALLIVVMLLPSIMSYILGEIGLDPFGLVSYLTIFIIYFGLAFIATFFNVCVVYTAKKRFEGKNATFGESIKFGFSRIAVIVAWSIVAATVGLILRILDQMAQRSKGVGKVFFNILVSILGAAWSIITLFVVPVMVYDNIGPFAAIKKSVLTLKKTWGESLVRSIGMGLVQIGFIVLGIIALVGIFFMSPLLGGYVTLGLFFVVAIYFIGVIVLFNLANTIFNTALFVYAETGKIPAGFSKELLQRAFQKKQE